MKRNCRTQMAVVIFVFFFGASLGSCATKRGVDVLKVMRPTHEILQCIDNQVKLYGDLCAESASGYEEMTGSDAHLEGVACAADSIKICLGLEE